MSGKGVDFIYITILVFGFFIACAKCELSERQDLLVLTVATEANDGYYRFMSSAEEHGFNVKVLGMGQTWKGGDVARYTGGGQKIVLLKEALEEYKDQANLVVLFVDCYDVIFTSGPEDIIKLFKSYESNVVFSAEAFCWPDPNLAEYYPTVKVTEKRYLNSGGFVGLAPTLYEIVTSSAVGNADDDQLFYSKVFLDKRNSLKIKLDTTSSIFQNLNGALDEVVVKFDESKTTLYNTKTGNTPVILHGNGPIKAEFNRLASYVADQWSPVKGCQGCQKNAISLSDVKVEDYPTVFIGLFIEHPTPFMEDFLNKIDALTYPKNRIDLYVHVADAYHRLLVEGFVSERRLLYRTVHFDGPESGLNDATARKLAVQEALLHNNDYYLSVDGNAQLEDTDIVQNLIGRNRSVVAPLLVRPGKMWSNFWGALTGDGFYKRSEDYVAIVQRTRMGMWNVPYVNGAYLVQKRHLPVLSSFPLDTGVDVDMVICKTLRDKLIFMYIDNELYYGHLIDSDNMEANHKHSDLWEIFDNRYTWEKKYIHEDYYKALQDATKKDVQQPCPDVFWFPILTDKFCDDYVDEMETFGQWSGGKHDDSRLQGGYENVPTVDIHTNQIGWERHWLHFLREFIAPLNAKVYEGYFTEGRAIMNFVVRYRPGEQDRLRPHSDSSTYTVNIALNTPNVDYEGGGVHFLRYNCSLVDLRKGWMLMHPGRLTHHHEGLPTTKGTRYIMVSFIDP